MHVLHLRRQIFIHVGMSRITRENRWRFYSNKHVPTPLYYLLSHSVTDFHITSKWINKLFDLDNSHPCHFYVFIPYITLPQNHKFHPSLNLNTHFKFTTTINNGCYFKCIFIILVYFHKIFHFQSKQINSNFYKL